MKSLFKNKLIVTLFIVLCVVILALSGIWLVQFINEKNNESEQAEVELNGKYYFGDVDEKTVEDIENGNFETPEIIPGKYYLNGDTSSYYFNITDDGKIELCCENPYEIFEKWNPGKEDVIKQDIAKWCSPQPYTVEVSPSGSVMLSVNYIYIDGDEETYMHGGPCLIDENTLGKWGLEGDFIRVD